MWNDLPVFKNLQVNSKLDFDLHVYEFCLLT